MVSDMLQADINRSRRIGVEYEMTVPLVGLGTGHDVQRTLANVLTANGLRAVARGYSADPVPVDIDLAVEYDSSVQGETRYHGMAWHSIEIKSRILNGIDDWEGIVPKMLDIARYMGARVNHSTGHHVHVALPEVAAKPKVIRSLASLVGRIEPVLYGLVAPSRSRSTYCVPLGGNRPKLADCKTLADYHQGLLGTSRYTALNLTNATGPSPRVEFRHHQGTLDTAKARHWLRFLLRITEHAVTRNCQSATQPIVNDRQGFERMATTIGLRVNSKIYRSVSPELTETASYLLRRWKHFNGQPIAADLPSLTEQAVEREVA